MNPLSNAYMGSQTLQCKAWGIEGSQQFPVYVYGCQLGACVAILRVRKDVALTPSTALATLLPIELPCPDSV